MPHRVQRIESPWHLYMDGSIWRFTRKEFDEMPPPVWPPNDENHFPLGKVPMKWIDERYVFIRWIDPGERINMQTGESY